MSNDVELDREELMSATISAMRDLPILTRLEFVKNLVFDRGGSRQSLPHDAVLITAVDVLDGVIRILKKRAKTANLRTIDR